MEQTSALRLRFERIQRSALVVGVLGVIILVLGALISREQFFQSYLIGYIFWFQLSLGCLIVLAIQHLVSGRWGSVAQRVLEAGASTLPLMALLFVPLLLGLPILYEWARPEVVAHDAILQQKAPYLNVSFFIIRAIIYFGVWMGIAHLLNKWSLQRDETGDKSLTNRLKSLSGPAIILLGLTLSFASIDWMMSLEPHWYSTIYGMIFGVGAAAAAFAFATLLLAIVWNDETLAEVLSVYRFNDLGNFLLTMVVLWAYVELSQYLIVWLGNLKEEIPWYLARGAGGWGALALILIGFHFVVPFFVLLSRSNKRNAGILAAVSATILAARFVNVYWLIAPAFHPQAFTFHWLDAATLIALGGVWIAVFMMRLKKYPLIPKYDSRLEEPAHGRHQAPSETY